MGTNNIDIIILYTALLSRCSDLSAYTSDGYIGCYDKLSLKILYRTSDILNTGGRCQSRCSARNYRYAATQHGGCYCGNKLMDEYATAKKCYVECPGDRKEICGGLYGQMSFFDIWETTTFAANTPTVPPTTPSTVPPTAKRAAATSTAEFTTTATSSEKATARSPTATITTTPYTNLVKSDITSSPSSRRSSTKVVVSVTESPSTEKELVPHIAVIAIPVAFVVVAVNILVCWICRRPGRTNDLNGAGRANQSGDTEVRVTRDDDIDHIYDQCVADYGNNSDYLTPVTIATFSRDTGNYETTFTDSTHRQPESSTSFTETLREEGACGEALKEVNQYDAILPKHARSENYYEALKRT